MPTVYRLITYSGSEDWIKKTLENSLNPVDRTAFLGKNNSISAKTILDPPENKGTSIKVEVLRDAKC